MNKRWGLGVRLVRLLSLSRLLGQLMSTCGKVWIKFEFKRRRLLWRSVGVSSLLQGRKEPAECGSHRCGYRSRCGRPFKLKYLWASNFFVAPSVFQSDRFHSEMAWNQAFKSKLHIACIKIKCSVRQIQNNNRCILKFHLKASELDVLHHVLCRSIWNNVETLLYLFAITNNNSLSVSVTPKGKSLL